MKFESWLLSQTATCTVHLSLFGVIIERKISLLTHILARII